MQLNHIPENIECFRAIDEKAYFQIDQRTCFYKFETKKEFESWKNKRSLENRRSRQLEYFMACDGSGLMDYLKLYKLHSSLGIVPPDPYCLAMLYAHDDHLKIDRDYIEENDTISEFLRGNQAKKCPIERKKPTNFPISNERKHRLSQLCKASKLPEHMGELFLNEIKLSTDDANKHLRDRIKILGLN